MKFLGMDFKQPSTWRGLLGLLALGGWTLSPELRDQIALTLASALAAIELFRDEYRPGAAADPATEQLRVPPVSPSTEPDPSHFAGDR